MTGSSGNEKRGGHQTPSPSLAREGVCKGMKSAAYISMPLAFAKPSKRGTCRNGTTPPVPPLSFGRHQLDTRVRWTPAMAATFVGPPRSLMIFDAGSMGCNVAMKATYGNTNMLRFPQLMQRPFACKASA